MKLNSHNFSSFLQSVEFDSITKKIEISTSQNAVLKIFHKVLSGLSFGANRTSWLPLNNKWQAAYQLWQSLYEQDSYKYSEEPETSNFTKPTEQGLRKHRDKLNEAFAEDSGDCSLICERRVIEYLCLIFFTRTYSECTALSEEQLVAELDPTFFNNFQSADSDIKSIFAFGFGVPMEDSLALESILKDSQTRLKYLAIAPNILNDMSYDDIFQNEQERLSYLEEAERQDNTNNVFNRACFPLRSAIDFSLLKQLLKTNFSVLLNLYNRLGSDKMEVKLVIDEGDVYQLAKSKLLKDWFPITQVTIINPFDRKRFLLLNSYSENKSRELEHFFFSTPYPSETKELDIMTEFWKSFIETNWNSDRFPSFETLRTLYGS
mgnify:CR=1 FL=1